MQRVEDGAHYGIPLEIPKLGRNESVQSFTKVLWRKGNVGARESLVEARGAKTTTRE
jgi:hypothetical protein